MKGFSEILYEFNVYKYLEITLSSQYNSCLLNLFLPEMEKAGIS